MDRFSNFNMAYDVLNHLYGGSLIRPPTNAEIPLTGQFATFDQQAFINPPTTLNTNAAPSASTLKWLAQSMRLYSGKNWSWPTSGLANWTIPSVKSGSEMRMVTTRSILSSLDREGFIYFPSACARGQNCSIHVALHGCQQGDHQIGNVSSLMTVLYHFRKSLCGRCIRYKSRIFGSGRIEQHHRAFPTGGTKFDLACQSHGLLGLVGIQFIIVCYQIGPTNVGYQEDD